jgi:hypothetical protein
MKGLNVIKEKMFNKAVSMDRQFRSVMSSLTSLAKNKSGDQMTGWLIVVLLVVVTGAVFLALYQSSIQDIWQGIVNKMKSVFGI